MVLGKEELLRLRFRWFAYAFAYHGRMHLIGTSLRPNTLYKYGSTKLLLNTDDEYTSSAHRAPQQNALYSYGSKASFGSRIRRAADEAMRVCFVQCTV